MSSLTLDSLWDNEFDQILQEEDSDVVDFYESFFANKPTGQDLPPDSNTDDFQKEFLHTVNAIHQIESLFNESTPSYRM